MNSTLSLFSFLSLFVEKNDLLQQLDSERNGSSEAQERYTRLGK